MYATEVTYRFDPTSGDEPQKIDFGVHINPGVLSNSGIRLQSSVSIFTYN